MNFLANPRYQVPSRADVGNGGAKEDRQGFCFFWNYFKYFQMMKSAIKKVSQKWKRPRK